MATEGSLGTSNPFDLLIDDSDNSIEKIQARYASHRLDRSAQQRQKLLDPAFSGVIVDQILRKIENPKIEPGYQDPRHCLVLWARPPERIRQLISNVQQQLLTIASNLWIMPPSNLHMTVLEYTHSQPAAMIESLIERVRSSLPNLVNFTSDHRTRLVKPMVVYDVQGVAISFLPAANEVTQQGISVHDDAYSYHHLRRDVYTAVQRSGVEVESRYVIPSAHLTVARFIDPSDFSDQQGKPDVAKMERFISTIDDVNETLKSEYWPGDGTQKESGGLSWMVGEGVGLDCRAGAAWYGGGRSVLVGDGF